MTMLGSSFQLALRKNQGIRHHAAPLNPGYRAEPKSFSNAIVTSRHAPQRIEGAMSVPDLTNHRSLSEMEELCTKYGFEQIIVLARKTMAAGAATRTMGTIRRFYMEHSQRGRRQSFEHLRQGRYGLGGAIP